MRARWARVASPSREGFEALEAEAGGLDRLPGALLLFAATTERHDVETGDRLRYGVAYRYRLWPERFRGRLVRLNGLLELNGT